MNLRLLLLKLLAAIEQTLAFAVTRDTGLPERHLHTPLDASVWCSGWPGKQHGVPSDVRRCLQADSIVNDARRRTPNGTDVC